MQTESNISYKHHYLYNYVVFRSSPTTSSEPPDTSNTIEIIEKTRMHNHNSLYPVML